MKHFIVILFSIFLFLGCTPQKVVQPPKQVETKKEVEVYPEPVIKEEPLIVEDTSFKVAVIFPSKVVGKYANSTINTIMGYLLFKNEKFELESFDSVTQDFDSMERVFNEASAKGYKKVIALYTKNALTNIHSFASVYNMSIYLPLVNKNESVYDNNNFFYGGISYQDQIAKLLTLSTGNNAMFYEESNIGRKLKVAYDNLVPVSSPVKSLKRIDTKYKRIVDDETLNEKTLMLNTPIIKSSILLSQLRAHDIKPQMILSTQLNYNPLLVSLTQFEDRVNFITASSIEQTDERLTEMLSLLGSEIGYNWVNYSSLVGINYLFSKNSDQLIKNSISNNQVNYNVYLYNSTEYGFQRIDF